MTLKRRLVATSTAGIILATSSLAFSQKSTTVPRQNSIRMELNPRVTLLHPQAILGDTEMLGFGKLLIRKVSRERGVLTRHTSTSAQGTILERQSLHVTETLIVVCVHLYRDVSLSLAIGTHSSLSARHTQFPLDEGSVKHRNPSTGRGG